MRIRARHLLTVALRISSFPTSHTKGYPIERFPMTLTLHLLIFALAAISVSSLDAGIQRPPLQRLLLDRRSILAVCGGASMVALPSLAIELRAKPPYAPAKKLVPLMALVDETQRLETYLKDSNVAAPPSDAYPVLFKTPINRIRNLFNLYTYSLEYDLSSYTLWAATDEERKSFIREQEAMPDVASVSSCVLEFVKQHFFFVPVAAAQTLTLLPPSIRSLILT